MNKEQTGDRILTIDQIDQLIEDHKLTIGFISQRIEGLKQAKELLEQNNTKLDELSFEKSQYGGEWVKKDQVPQWAKDFKFPLETTKYKYYLTSQGNLKRYPSDA